MKKKPDHVLSDVNINVPVVQKQNDEFVTINKTRSNDTNVVYDTMEEEWKEIVMGKAVICAEPPTVFSAQTRK